MASNLTFNDAFFCTVRSVSCLAITAVGFGLLGSAISVPSCHWLRLRGRDESNRNVGIWRRSTRGDDGSCWFDCCSPYPHDFEPDANLKTARAGSILSPIFGGISVFSLLNQDKAFKAIRWKIAVVCSTLAAIFQGLTMIVQHTQLCDVSLYSYCHVGISTWAFWMSLASTICYVTGACIGTGPMTAGPPEEENQEQ